MASPSNQHCQQAKPSHHAIGGIMAGMIIAHFPLIFPIFLFAQNRGK
ncbi:hypothetical protein AO367_1889 [Moraxella catarrhalis]|nr:hypothetical protein AO367_1889 [Moraxella catarrhalis]